MGFRLRALSCLRLSAPREAGREEEGVDDARYVAHDGHVVEEDEKVLGASLKAIPHLCGYLLALHNELDGVVLCDDALEHLIHDRGENPAADSAPLSASVHEELAM